MKKCFLFISVFLTFVTGCSSIPLLPQPYEVRYFTTGGDFDGWDRERINKIFEKKCPDTKSVKVSNISKKYLSLSWNIPGLYLPGGMLIELPGSFLIKKDIPYQVVATEGNSKYLIPKNDKIWSDYVIRIPIDTLKKCSITEETYKKRKKEKDRKRLAAKAVAKKKAELEKADCKVAKEKAENRKKEIKKALGLNPDEMLYYFTGVHKVVDFSTNGVFIENDCYRDHLRNMYLAVQYGADTRNLCETERKFIYTTDSYAQNDFFDNTGLFVQTENYRYTTVTGGINVVHAYKQTPYKKEEVEYKTYLKNKNNECD